MIKPAQAAALNPYTLPDGHVQIAFSGGRTSAYMLHQIIEANGSLPDRVIVSFQNTGREMPETLDFVHECGVRWGVDIVWLEWRDSAERFERVSHNSASRNGEPFAALARKRKFLPNRVARFCTTELKVHTSTRYARSLGWERWHSAIGIRADEPRRLGGTTDSRERFTHWYPLAAANVSKRDVTAFWARQPFDLQLQNVNGKTPFGNCDGCFLKSEATRASLARLHPDRFQWWVDLEQSLGSTFRPAEPYSQLRDFVANQGRLFDDTDQYCQADGGECFG